MNGLVVTGKYPCTDNGPVWKLKLMAKRSEAPVSHKLTINSFLSVLFVPVPNQLQNISCLIDGIDPRKIQGSSCDLVSVAVNIC